MVRRKRAAHTETASYVLEIATWNWSLSFGVDATRDRSDPYSDCWHLEIEGRLLQSRAPPTETARCTLLPDVRLNEGNRASHDPKVVGSVNLRRGAFDALLSMPADAIPATLIVLSAGRMRYVVMDAERLRYGRSMIRHFRIDSVFDDSDFEAR